MPSTTSSATTSKRSDRTSILSAASDALNLRRKIGSVSRRKQPSPHADVVVPGVIEISARNNTTVVAGPGPHRDCEHEERERLRDAAAQSIGLGPDLFSDPLLSPVSFPRPAPSLPPFPAPFPALHPFVQFSATVPKFAPHASLLVSALAKQWRTRTIVLTSHPPTQQTHVHLFKATSKSDREIERLQVTEDSVIFVADEHVGGRRNVVKLAGKDASAKPVMWFLHITNPAESRRWITAVKSAVLTQRAGRAGIDISAQSNGARNQPRGDMDVMLSMHLQGIISMDPPPTPPLSPSPPPSLRSLRLSSPSSPSPTATMKGIFSNTRPRSPSIEGSSSHPSGHGEDSFGVAGTSLLTMLRSKSSAESTSSPSHSLPLPHSNVSGRGSPAPSLRSANVPIITASDLRISKERDAPEPVRPNTAPPIPFHPTHGTPSLSLQPPPRKPKPTPILPAPLLSEQTFMYKQPDGNHSVAGNFGIPSGAFDDHQVLPLTPTSFSFSGAVSGSFLPSVSVEGLHDAHAAEENNELPSTPTVANGNGSGAAHSPPVTKRWSRQGVLLPKQPTPPSDPLPSIPLSSESIHCNPVELSISVPPVARSPSVSSNSLSRPRTSPISGSSVSPTFWRRASGSSMCSVSSASTRDSRGRPLPVPSGPNSLPSSLRSVAGNGASSRPMSLSVSISSPVAYIATAKRRSMPPPRPAPNFAPPPAPIIQESTMPGPSRIPAFVPAKSFRNSVAQRAMRLSLTSPKPPPSSALPPRPDEPAIARGHRRGSSAGAQDIYPAPPPSSRPSSAPYSDPNQSSPPSRSLSIRQRLRILSTPPVSPSPSQTQSQPQTPSSSIPPSLQVSTLDLSDDNDDDLPTPYFHSPQLFMLGEHISTIHHEPSFLQLSNAAASTPVVSSPTVSKPPLLPPSLPILNHSRHSLSFRPLPPLPPLSSASTGESISESDCDFVALSPPPPRRGSKPFAVSATMRPENKETDELGGGSPREERL